MGIDFVRDQNDWDYGTMYFECDLCGEISEAEGSFHDCIAQAKEDGWIVYLAEDDIWTHLCSANCGASQVFD